MRKLEGEQQEVSSFKAFGDLLSTEPEMMVKAAGSLLKIRDRHGRLRPLWANAAQRSFEQRRGQHNVVLKARQMGITTWVAGRFLLQTAWQPGTATLLVAHTREAAENIFAMVRRMWECLPKELREDVLQVRRFNAGEIVFMAGGEYRVASAADTNAGRGLSLRNLHCSEVSRWASDAGATLGGLRAALAPEGEMVLESTPNGAYGAFYEAWRDAVDATSAGSWAANQGVGFNASGRLVRHFFPWWIEEAYAGLPVPANAMNADEQQLVARYGLSAEQIGFRRGLEKSYGPLRSQEFAEDAETCFRTTGSCCFELEPIERRLAEVPEPMRKGRNAALQVWLPAMAGRKYLLAVDTAGGGEDGDFAAVQVLDVATGMQCAELQERLRPAALANVCVELSREYGDALIAVERNNHGAAVLALLETRPGVRCYRQGGQAGWLTSAASKPEVIARLGRLLQQTPELFMSRRLLGECRTFVSDERGHAGAAGGAHDDLVMAMAIAQVVRAEVLTNSGVRGCDPFVASCA